MSIYFLPRTREKQLEVIQSLLQVRLLPYEQKRELERIKRELGYRIQLNQNDKEFLQRMITKYGWLTK